MDSEKHQHNGFGRVEHGFKREEFTGFLQELDFLQEDETVVWMRADADYLAFDVAVRKIGEKP